MNVRPYSRCIPQVLGRWATCRTAEVKAHGECGGGGTEGQSTTCSENAAYFPTADDLIDPARNAAAEHASTTEWQLINEVGIDQVTNVEVCRSTADAKVGKVAHDTASYGVHHARPIVYRMGPGVVEVELETL